MNTLVAEKQPSAKYRLPADKAAIIRTNPPANLTVMEAGAYLCVSPRKIRELVAERRLKCARIGSRLVFKRSWLDELLGSTA
jgi:excisionase family DNA binding protein